MAMVAVGGSIGTGLLLGAGAAMEIAGPAAVFSFLAAAFVNWTVAMALGELACAHPAAGSFGVYGELYLNQFAGFLARAGYWLGIALNIGVEMVAAATYMSYWFPTVRPYLWIVIFAALLLAINLRSVGSYGRVEFWLSMIKLATVLAYIAIAAALLASHRVAPQYAAYGGFFPKGVWATLIAMTFAIYSFGGVEMVAVTTGESRSPKETPRAVWLTFLTLSFVYVGAMLVLPGVMPWNHAGVTESPFVATFRLVKIPHAPDVMNFVSSPLRSPEPMPPCMSVPACCFPWPGPDGRQSVSAASIMPVPHRPPLSFPRSEFCLLLSSCSGSRSKRFATCWEPHSLE